MRTRQQLKGTEDQEAMADASLLPRNAAAKIRIKRHVLKIDKLGEARPDVDA